jgi:hypothetical protein
MPLPKDKAWFAAKTYGWGWGFPMRWQGWVVMVGFVLAIAVGAPLVKRGAVFFVAYCVALGAVLMAICYWKGEAPRWRWGSDE